MLQMCRICLEEYPTRDMLAAPCNHFFCRSACLTGHPATRLHALCYWYSQQALHPHKVWLSSGAAAAVAAHKCCWQPRRETAGFNELLNCCSDCWSGYVSTAISSGPSVLNLRCPLPECQQAVSRGPLACSGTPLSASTEPELCKLLIPKHACGQLSCYLAVLLAGAVSCSSAFASLQVPQTIIRRVSSDADEAKFSQYALRSFVEDNKRLTWCPAPGGALLSPGRANQVMAQGFGVAQHDQPAIALLWRTAECSWCQGCMRSNALQRMERCLFQGCMTSIPCKAVNRVATSTACRPLQSVQPLWVLSAAQHIVQDLPRACSARHLLQAASMQSSASRTSDQSPWMFSVAVGPRSASAAIRRRTGR